MSDIKVEKYYQIKAKELTNMLFDKGYLNEDLTRESIDWLEDFIGFILQSNCEISAKVAVLTKRLRDKDITQSK